MNLPPSSWFVTRLRWMQPPWGRWKPRFTWSVLSAPRNTLLKWWAAWHGSRKHCSKLELTPTCRTAGAGRSHDSRVIRFERHDFSSVFGHLQNSAAWSRGIRKRDRVPAAATVQTVSSVLKDGCEISQTSHHSPTVSPGWTWSWRTMRAAQLCGWPCSTSPCPPTRLWTPLRTTPSSWTAPRLTRTALQRNWSRGEAILTLLTLPQANAAFTLNLNVLGFDFNVFVSLQKTALFRELLRLAMKLLLFS